jgi:prophage regulatory protein
LPTYVQVVKLVALADIATMLGGVSRTRAVEIVRRPGFPEPIDVVGNGRMRIWSRDEVAAWIAANRPSQRED